MKSKRIVSLGLCVVLALALTACGGPDTPSGSTPGTSGTSPSTPSGSQTDGELQVSQAFLDDLKGTEMTVTYPWVVEKRGDSADADRMWDNVKKVEEKYGVKIDLKSGKNSYVQVMVTSLLAKKPMGDVLMCQDGYFADWYNAGIFCDLTDAAKEIGMNFSDERFNQNVTEYTNINNQQCGFYYGYDAPSSIFYNKRLLAEKGLEDPHELLKKNEWTFAKLEEYAGLLKKTDASGTVTQWGLGAWGSSDFLACCVNANDGKIVGLDADSHLTINLNDPATMEAMEFMHKLTTVNKTLDAVDPAAWEGKMYDFIDGKYAMLHGTSSTLNFCYRRGMKDDYGVISFPVGPSNKSGMVDCMTNITFFFIPKLHEENASKYLFLMDELNKIDDRDPEEAFAESYALKLPDEASYNQYYARMHRKPHFELIYMSGCMWTEPGLGEIAGALGFGTSTPGVLADTYNTMLQSALNDKWANMQITGVKAS